MIEIIISETDDNCGPPLSTLSDSIIFKWHEKPERWRPSRMPSFSVFLPKDVKWRHTMWCYMTSVIWQDKSESPQVNHASENPKIMFFNLATLTFDLWPWPSKSSEILSRSTLHQILGLYVKRFSRKSAELQTDTHAHTDGTDFIPSLPTREGKISARAYQHCISAWIKVATLY